MNDKIDSPPVICTCERSRFLQFKSSADVICSEETTRSNETHELIGYRLYAVEQWLLNEFLAHWVLVERTEQPEDKIVVSSYWQSVDSTSAQVNAWHTIFVSAEKSEGMIPRDTPYGTLLTGDPNVFREKFDLNLIHLPSGDFEQYKHDLLYRLSLKRLSCCSPKLPLSLKVEDGQLLESNFISLYRDSKFNNNNVNSSSNNNENNESNANSTVTTMQNNVRMQVDALVTLLRETFVLLGYRDARSAWHEGVYDERLMRAVRAFEAAYNRAVEDARQSAPPDSPPLRLLPGNGTVDPFTIEAICLQRPELRKALAEQGCVSAPRRGDEADGNNGDDAANHGDDNHASPHHQQLHGSMPHSNGAGNRTTPGHRALQFVERKATRVLDAPSHLARGLSRHLNSISRHAKDDTDPSLNQKISSFQRFKQELQQTTHNNVDHNAKQDLHNNNTSHHHHNQHHHHASTHHSPLSAFSSLKRRVKGVGTQSRATAALDIHAPNRSMTNRNRNMQTGSPPKLDSFRRTVSEAFNNGSTKDQKNNNNNNNGNNGNGNGSHHQQRRNDKQLRQHPLNRHVTIHDPAQNLSAPSIVIGTNSAREFDSARDSDESPLPQRRQTTHNLSRRGSHQQQQQQHNQQRNIPSVVSVAGYYLSPDDAAASSPIDAQNSFQLKRANNVLADGSVPLAKSSDQVRVPSTLDLVDDLAWAKQQQEEARHGAHRRIMSHSPGQRRRLERSQSDAEAAFASKSDRWTDDSDTTRASLSTIERVLSGAAARRASHIDEFDDAKSVDEFSSPDDNREVATAFNKDNSGDVQRIASDASIALEDIDKVQVPTLIAEKSGVPLLAEGEYKLKHDHRISANLREKLRVVAWREAASSVLDGARLTFACADRQLCDVAVSRGLVTLEAWLPDALVGYRLLIVDSQCVEGDGAPRVVLETTVSRRHRLPAGVLRARDNLDKQQREQLTDMFFRPLLPQLAALCVLRGPSTLGLIPNVYVDSVADEIAAARRVAPADAALAFAGEGASLTPVPATEQLSSTANEAAFLLTLRRLQCLPGAALLGASPVVRLRAARRVLRADYGQWLKSQASTASSSVTNQTELLEALGLELSAIIEPVTYALYALLAFGIDTEPPAARQHDYINYELLNAARLHTLRSSLQSSLGDAHHDITPTLISTLQHQMELLNGELESSGFDCPKDPFFDFKQMHKVVDQCLSKSRSKYVAIVKSVIIASIVERVLLPKNTGSRASPPNNQRALTNQARRQSPLTIAHDSDDVSSSPTTPSTSMMSVNGSSADDNDNGGKKSRNTSGKGLQRFATTHANTGSTSHHYQRPSLPQRHHATRQRGHADSVEATAMLVHRISEEHAEQLDAERRLWQQRLEAQQRELESLRAQLVKVEEAHDSMMSTVTSARAANATLKRQLHSTLELVTTHGERVRSYEMKLAALKQTVDKVEHQNHGSFVRRYAWTLLTSIAALLAVGIALLSSGVAIASGRARALDVVNRARRDVEVAVAEVAPDDFVDDCHNINDNNNNNNNNNENSSDQDHIKQAETTTNDNNINDKKKIDAIRSLQKQNSTLHLLESNMSKSSPQEESKRPLTPRKNNIDNNNNNNNNSNNTLTTSPVKVEPSSSTSQRSTPSKLIRQATDAKFASTPTTPSALDADAVRLTPSSTMIGASTPSPNVRRRRVSAVNGRRIKLSDYIEEIKFGD